MIRQFPIIPALLGIAALVISACSAEVGGGNSKIAGVELNESTAGTATTSASSGSTSSSVVANTGATTVMEGTWIGVCDEEGFGNGTFTKEIVKYVGNTFDLEQLTYSDAQCTQRTSGLDFRANGTFTIEDGGTFDGKQLKKQKATWNVTYSEGFIALFLPIGHSYDATSYIHLDGNKYYYTDGGSNLLTGEKDAPSTEIRYDDYYVKQ